MAHPVFLNGLDQPSFYLALSGDIFELQGLFFLPQSNTKDFTKAHKGVYFVQKLAVFVLPESDLFPVCLVFLLLPGLFQLAEIF
jgi:hypothetical protein